MRGITLHFRKRIDAGRDALNNAIYHYEDISVDDCLIAPTTEPSDRPENAALDRDQIMVRVHLPKASDADISDCTFEYDNQNFRVIARAVRFMNENTPTRWNRYYRAESING